MLRPVPGSNCDQRVTNGISLFNSAIATSIFTYGHELMSDGRHSCQTTPREDMAQ